jgi:hypothetical protein
MNQRYVVHYQYATYSGDRVVFATDDDEAIAIVRARVRREGGLPMAYESYRVISATSIEE